MDIKEYIESGILEAYVFGSASEAESEELLKLKIKHPQIKDALDELEMDLERIAQHMAVAPPPGRWNKIETELNELIKLNESAHLKITGRPNKKDNTNNSSGQDEFIKLTGPADHMRVHKLWRLLVMALIILGLIFLGFALYLGTKNKQAEQQIQELKQELKSQSQP